MLGETLIVIASFFVIGYIALHFWNGVRYAIELRKSESHNELIYKEARQINLQTMEQHNRFEKILNRIEMLLSKAESTAMNSQETVIVPDECK